MIKKDIIVKKFESKIGKFEDDICGLEKLIESKKEKIRSIKKELGQYNFMLFKENHMDLFGFNKLHFSLRITVNGQVYLNARHSHKMDVWANQLKHKFRRYGMQGMLSEYGYIVLRNSREGFPYKWEEKMACAIDLTNDCKIYKDGRYDGVTIFINKPEKVLDVIEELGIKSYTDIIGRKIAADKKVHDNIREAHKKTNLKIDGLNKKDRKKVTK